MAGGGTVAAWWPSLTPIQTQSWASQSPNVGGSDIELSNPNGDYAYVATGSSVAVIDATTPYLIGPTVINTISTESRALAASPQGPLYVIGPNGAISEINGTMLLGGPIWIDYPTGNVLSPTARAAPKAVAVSSDGAHVYVSDTATGSVLVINVAALNRVAAEQTNNRWPHHLGRAHCLR